MTRSATDPIPIESVQVSVYDIPTDNPESDGTLSWDSTTFVLVTIGAGGHTGVGYTYGGPAAATVVNSELAGVLTGRDALLPAARWNEMQHAVRNLGTPGVVATAISAVDIALWDLRARLLNEPLTVAIGAVHDATPIYGSGGFTSYDNDRPATQLSDWVDAGIPRVKMKVGRNPTRTATASQRRWQRSAGTPSYTSTPTAPTPASRRCCGRSGSPTTASDGWRSR